MEHIKDYTQKIIGKQTIQGKLQKLLMPIIIVLLLLMMVINYQMYVRSTDVISKNYIKQMAIRSSDEVSASLKTMRNELEAIADRSEVKTMDWEKMKEYINRQAIHDSIYYSMLFIVAPDGTYWVANKGLAQNLTVRDRGYVQAIFNNKKDFAITSPDISRLTGEKKYTIAVPVKDNNGAVIGCVAANISLNTLSKTVNSHKIGEHGSCFVTDEKATIIAHQNSNLIMNFSYNSNECSTYKGLAPFAHAFSTGTTADGYVTDNDKVTSYMIITPIADTPNWSLGVTVPKDEIRDGVGIIFLIMFGFCILILSAVVFTIHKGIDKAVTKPINWLSTIVKDVADGNLVAKYDYESKDEIGQMAESLRSMNEKLLDIVKAIKDGAQELNAASEQVSASAQQMSQGANEQAASIEEVSATMEQMASNIEQNTQNAEQTAHVSDDAYQKFKNIAEKANHLNGINKNIAQRILVINDIATQTNILALNAAVEAARAGEYGRGFAVVAAEVRKLAEHSKKAADEIINLTQNCVTLTERANIIMGETLPKVENTKSLVDEIAAASAEQSSGAMQINDAIQQLNSVIRVNAASSEELASSAEYLSENAQKLLDTIAYFKTE